MQVGLQVGALGPFIPGVDADDRLAVERAGLRVPHQPFQPRLVAGGRRAVQHQAGALPAGVVVPGRGGGADQGERRRRLRQRLRHHLPVIVDLRVEVAVQHVQRRVDGGQPADQLVRRELDRAVEAVFARVVVAEALRHHEQRVLARLRLEQPAPAGDRVPRVRDHADAVDHQQRPAADADVAPVGEVAREAADQRQLVLGPVVLGDEDVLVGAVPAPGPVLVGPHQAERQLEPVVGEQRLQRPVQQPLAVEPVEVEHEALDAGLAGHRRLPAQHRGALQPVVAQVARDAGLVVAGEARQAARHVGPFGEALAPPLVVARHGVELRQVVGQHPRPPARRVRQRPPGLEQRSGLGVAAHLARHRGLAGRQAGVHPRAVAVRHVVQQRVALGLAAQVALPVEGGVEAGERAPRLAEALHHVVLERVEPGGGDIRIRLQVERAVELGHGAVRAARAVQQVVAQRRHAGRHLVGAAIPGRIEPAAGPPSFRLAARDVVQQRVDPLLRHVRVLLEVPARVEVEVGLAAFAPAIGVVVRHRLVAQPGHVGVAGEVVLDVEQAGLRDQLQRAGRLGAACHGRGGLRGRDRLGGAHGRVVVMGEGSRHRTLTCR